ncbi:hypothetical protein IM40_06760 [Candidatus Paracaedimonas acanthamoebae]|nr:hypothetical protein IM40_06760 [Candidatus Paracaedimonas acanthamoebae]
MGIQGAKRQFGEKPEFKSWINALDILENKTKSELHHGKDFLEAVFAYAKANFITTSAQATVKEKQTFKVLQLQKNKKLLIFLKLFKRLF